MDNNYNVELSIMHYVPSKIKQNTAHHVPDTTIRQANTNSTNKTCALPQTTGGNDFPYHNLTTPRRECRPYQLHLDVLGSTLFWAQGTVTSIHNYKWICSPRYFGVFNNNLHFIIARILYHCEGSFLQVIHFRGVVTNDNFHSFDFEHARWKLF